MEALLEVKPMTPLLLRRLQQKPRVQDLATMSHMTIVTTQGYTPEMNDQVDDSTRYDKD